MEQTPTPTSNSSSKFLFEDSPHHHHHHQNHNNNHNNKVSFSSFPNGAIKKHQHQHYTAGEDLLYRECLRNHAASLGGHALDGCGEFMPSPAANPAEPTSLRCAACGCHRNFHRRLSHHHHHHNLLTPRRHDPDEKEDANDTDDADDEDDDEDADKEIHNTSISPPPPPPSYSSAPHMLLALSSGLSAGAGGPNTMRPVAAQSLMTGGAGAATMASTASVSRKRFRTKFSPEQKEKMQELSERLGWRMQKRDEGMVEEWCREIGVTKGVFKVWMHNNKHHFFAAGRRALPAGIQGFGNGGGENGSSGNGHVLNGSSSSS